MKYSLKKYVYILCLFAFIVKFANAQDPVFSQFYTATMFLNPALAADRQGVNATFNNRTLTNKQISSYDLNHLSVILPIQFSKYFRSITANPNHASAFAFSVYREATGHEAKLNTFGLVGTYAHSLQLAKEHFLSVGLQGGYVQKHHNDMFQWGSQYDTDWGYNPDITPGVEDVLNLKIHYPVINFGIVWFYKNSSLKKYMRRLNVDVFSGISLYNVNTPNQSFIESSKSYLPMQIKLHGGLLYELSPIIQINPNYIIVRQNANMQYNFGTLASFTTPRIVVSDKDVSALLGVWYRWNDSFILSIGSKIQSFTFVFSYDFNTSSFAYNNRGKSVVELSLKYSLKPPKETMQRGLLYPTFM